MSSCPPSLELSLDSPVYAAVLAATIIFPLYVLACFAYFYYNRKTSVFLRKRPLDILVMSMVGTVSPWIAFALYDAMGPSLFPCWLFLFFCYATFALLISPTILTLARYRNDVATRNLNGLIASLDANDPLVLEFGTRFNGEGSFRTLYAHVSMAFCPGRKYSREKRTKILNSKFCESKWFVILWFLLTASPYMLGYVIILPLNPQNNCPGCEISSADCIFFLSMAPVALFIGLSSTKAQTMEKDPLQIVHECVRVWSLGITSLVGWICFLADPSQVENRMRWRLLELTSICLVVYYQTVHQVVKSRRLHLKQELLVSDKFNTDDRFQDIMKDKTGKLKLKRHMNSELSSEIVDFLESVLKFKAEFAGRSVLANQEAAKEIMDKFVVRNSVMEVNLSSACREATLKQPLSADMFDAAYHSVKDEFLRDGFVRFLKQVKTSQIMAVSA